MDTKFNLKLTRFDIHMICDAITHEQEWIEKKVMDETDELAIACMRERYRKLIDLKVDLVLATKK